MQYLQYIWGYVVCVYAVYFSFCTFINVCICFILNVFSYYYLTDAYLQQVCMFRMATPCIYHQSEEDPCA